jgi:hypothetical protein
VRRNPAQPPAHPVALAVRTLDDDGEHQAVAVGIRHRPQQMVTVRAVAEHHLVVRSRRAGSVRPADGLDGHPGDLGMLRAEHLRVHLVRARETRVEQHPAVDVGENHGDDPAIAQQRSEHDGKTVRPDVLGVPMAPAQA